MISKWSTRAFNAGQMTTEMDEKKKTQNEINFQLIFISDLFRFFLCMCECECEFVLRYWNSVGPETMPAQCYANECAAYVCERHIKLFAF